MSGTSIVSNSKPAGGAVFNAIVTVLRNRTGMDYTAAFNKVLADNADLIRKPLDATNHTGPLLRLLNRTQSATGRSATDSTELATDKVAKLTNRFFPALNAAPTALQWDVLSRAAAQLEKCGIPSKIYNRASNADVSPKDLKSANDCEADVLSFLEKQEDDSDLGNHGSFQNLSSGGKFAVFQRNIKRLMSEKGISLQEAFNELKETQPIFWVHSILSFQPDK
jgi:hypothetical protein